MQSVLISQDCENYGGVGLENPTRCKEAVYVRHLHAIYANKKKGDECKRKTCAASVTYKRLTDKRSKS